MSNSVMFWLLVAALLFWAVGAHNRLMRLRSQGIVAFTAFEALLNQYLLLVRENLPSTDVGLGVRASLDNDPGVAAWAALVAAADQFRASLKVARTQPLNGPTTSALSTAIETLRLSWLRLRNLPPDLAGSALPETLLTQWAQLSLQAEVARNNFNKAVLNYNDAIGQFPAILLAGVLGFRPAQQI
jgi:LemA protein